MRIGTEPKKKSLFNDGVERHRTQNVRIIASLPAPGCVRTQKEEEEDRTGPSSKEAQSEGALINQTRRPTAVVVADAY